MIFEFIADSNFNFLQSFASHLGVQIDGDVLRLPDVLGDGSISRMRFSSDFSMLVHHFTLREPLIIRRDSGVSDNDAIVILLQSELTSYFTDYDENQPELNRGNFPIRISSTNVFTELSLPKEKELFFVVLTAKRQGLKSLLGIREYNSTVETILTDRSSFLYYEHVTEISQRLLHTLLPVDDNFQLLRLKNWIVIQEMILSLFAQLLKREAVKQKVINQSDAIAIDLIRNVISLNLKTPPQLPDLGRLANMSVSKLTDTFRQVFGVSIYNYYQTLRFQKAEYMLRQGFSVSETGYQLGFTNMSHFSRLFNKFHGTTPKKFASTNGIKQAKASPGT